MNKVDEIKDMIYDKAMEKKAFYGKVGMKHGRFTKHGRDESVECCERLASVKPQQIDSNRVYEALKKVDKINVTEGEKVKLRQQILARAKEMKINTKGWSK